MSEKIAELLDCQPRIPNNSKRGKGVYRIMTCNRYGSPSVRHDVSTLEDDRESSWLQCLDRLQVVDARKLSHSGRHYFDAASLLPMIQVVYGGKVINNGGFDVLQRLSLGDSLRPAAAEFGTTCGKTLLGRHQFHLVFHLSSKTTSAANRPIANRPCAARIPAIRF
ncbi:MAG TPA: hypothetical protein VME18_13225 [Acidobacteriaceae bacterium]|nr:hypothetical protein [Acidobacteriaceae bacterium]